MGDRGNIAVQFDGDKNKRVWFYTHWSGYNMDSIIAAALDRGRPRWQDDSYITRIIFCELVQDSVMDETGFGLSLQPQDNEYPFRVVDLQSKTVFQEPDDRKGFEFVTVKKADLLAVPFEQFIAKHAKVKEAA